MGADANGDARAVIEGERYTEPVRTDVYCHSCNKNFVAKLDYRIDGNHRIVCPYCGHEHWRQIKDGVVTSDRWGSSNGMPTVEVDKRSIWTHDSLPIQTSTASRFIREKWLDRGCD